MSKIFNKIAGARVGRSVFNLSYEKKLTCDMGELIPIMCDEMIPGDVFSIGNELVIRFQPLVAPLLHEVNAYIHYYYVPYRLLWDDWESFITGGADGTETPTIPTWDPDGEKDRGSLWDHLGFPTAKDVAEGGRPIDFPRRAYNMIYNEYYRDQNLITEVLETNEDVLIRAWEKDYFTSCLPWQQRGTAPALPISGVLDVDPSGTEVPEFKIGATDPRSLSGDAASAAVEWNSASGHTDVAAWSDPKLEVDLSGGTTFDIADLRLAVQIQRWLERNARAGSRYTEFLRAHFGIAPRDDRLDRPEYIGGSKAPVIFSEVLQTSSTDGVSPQANLAGHGITVDKRFIGKYRSQEFGLVMGILSVMPRTAYQQGINRQWLRYSKYDFFFPELANLSEQAVIVAELRSSTSQATNETIFGYQGRYDEMRQKSNMVAGQMRLEYDYWHLGRLFGSAVLNQSFIECVPRKDIFAAPEEPALIISVGNIIKAVRPIPIMSNPGLNNV